ncbi:MAG: 50S ribosomal protein L18 [Ignavibacteriales bacterium]|nr:50S ribosomal protein L18 [Ignavibacteriales bacterium]
MIQKKSSERRLKAKARIRKKVFGTPERPRLVVNKTLHHAYAQIVDDIAGKTLVAASSVAKDLKTGLKDKKPMDVFKEVGKVVAQKALEKNITQVVFDRNGFLYHGRIKALADGAREGGLKF